MSITAMAGRTITVYRRTAFIIDSEALSGVPASLAVDRQPAHDSIIQVRLTGAGAGTITVNGDVDGVPDTEVLAFSGSGIRATVKTFDAGSITGLDYSAGFSGADAVQAKSLGANGHPHHNPTTLVTGWPARFDRARSRYPVPASGAIEVEKTRVYLDYTTVWTPREGDVFVDERTSEEFFVIGHPELHGGGQAIPHHWEFEVERREQSSTT